MAMIAVWLKVDGERLAATLQEAGEKLDSAEGEAVLDFSSVRRVDSEALAAMEKLAAVAEEKSVRIVLRGVGIDVYKVLKLVKLAPRFAFLP